MDVLDHAIPTHSHLPTNIYAFYPLLAPKNRLCFDFVVSNDEQVAGPVDHLRCIFVVAKSKILEVTRV